MNVNIPLGAVSCYATKAGKITDPYFFVKVPVLGLDADTQDGAAKTEIKAKNATDYRIYHDGDIKYETASHFTEKEFSSIPDGPEIETIPPSHYHKHIGKGEYGKVHYYNLNEVPVNVGDLLLGLFLDGDTKNLVIFHIPHKVPLSGDVSYD